MTDSDFHAERTVPAKFSKPETRREALALFEGGTGYTAAARKLGLPVYTVREWHRAWKAGSFTVEVLSKMLPYSEATRREAVALRKSGLSWTQFEHLTGISRAACIRWMKAEDALVRSGE